MKKNSHKITSVSGILKNLIKTHRDDQYLTYHELIKSMGERAYGVIAILFALPSALPVSVIPGISFVFGLPIFFIAIHMILAKKSLWLPKALAERQVAVAKLATIIEKTIPYLLYVERRLKPRWLFFSSPFMVRLHGVILLELSVLLLLPIPFSNFIFSSLIILFGLGIAEKDGAFLALAYLGSFLYSLFLGYLARGLAHYFMV